MFNRIAAFSILAALAAPSPCLAWGAEGHRIVAAIAADELTPAARQHVAELLGTKDARAEMIAVSTWADEIRRSRPNTAAWHFTDIPVGSAGYDAGRDCPRDQCSVAQIQREEQVLADRQLLPAVRAEVLRFIIHFIGDLHQPLHSANNDDRGGNQVRVIVGRRHTNLHAVWDVDVVRALGRDPADVAQRLERENTPVEKQIWSTGTPVAWANETFQIARSEVYGLFSGNGGTEAEIILSPGYARQESDIAAQQLEKAGVRLATVLNATLR